ncbi:MAG: type 2 lanthipeptide synthetase LanM family protein [Vicinamibacterales bacterium]
MPTLSSTSVSGFLRVVAPMIEQGQSRLLAGMRRLSREGAAGLLDPDRTAEQLRVALDRTLLRVISRTLVLELHLDRQEGRLRGATSAARFEDFVDTLGDRDRAQAVLRRYPVLAEQVARCIEQWTDAGLTCLARLFADWQQIARRLRASRDPGALVGVEAGLSDRHGGGHAVLRARFASGFTLIYKPRSLALDAHFQELLAWMNDRGLDPAWRTLGVIDRGDYGWVECVGRASCTSAAAVERFFARQGAYLALLYALDATDLHHENLVADGEDPMLIDLEALFHPRAIGPAGEVTASAGVDAMTHSVMRVGLLPERVWSSPSHEGFDISGLSAPGGQRSPEPVLQWANPGTDTMHVVRGHVSVPAGANRPLFGGTDLDAADHAGAIASGFSRAYRLLCRYRPELLADDGPLARFERDEIRVIVRPTRIYARLLDESLHPDLQRHAPDRDRFVDRLWVGVDEHPHLAPLVPSETQDLRNLDIPRFTAQPGSAHLWDSRGRRFGGMLRETPMAGVRRRIAQLSDRDLERQRWFITASLAAIQPSLPHHASPARRTRSTAHAPRPGLIALARQIGDRLEATACHGSGEVAWMGISPRGTGQWALAPVGLDLYDGLPGIAFFLAHLADATGEPRYRALADTTLSTILGRLHSEDDSRPVSAGAFNGWGGLIYTLSHLGQLWGTPDLIVTAASLLQPLVEAVHRDDAFDVIDGSAGAILALLALNRCDPTPAARAALLAGGERLIERATPLEVGIGWPGARAPQPLAGMAHGNAGMALALVQLGYATGVPRFARAAEEAVAYERAIFSVDAANWPDLRPRDAVATGGPRFMTAWCHGAPGIGLARLRAAAQMPDADSRREIDVAIGTVLGQGAMRSQCLCHGELGNLELLLEAADPADAALSRQVQARVTGLTAALTQDGPVCGSPGQVETPGLLTGLAGIGYGLLRLSDPGRFPSVLALDPPRCSPAPRLTQWQ